MRRFVYWLFPIIAITVAIFIVVFMIQINPKVSLEEEKQYSQDTPVNVEERSRGWINDLTVSDEKGYLYPVNELTLQTDDNLTNVQPPTLSAE
ncbi:MAG: hypothetical protein NTY39_10580 [Campylobacterales bacterium]|nr:hypothetical protein [Campylobacterales bacterium]